MTAAMSRACSAEPRKSSSRPSRWSDGPSTETTRKPAAANLSRERMRKFLDVSTGLRLLNSRPGPPVNRITLATGGPGGVITQKACVTPGRVSSRISSSASAALLAASSNSAVSREITLRCMDELLTLPRRRDRRFPEPLASGRDIYRLRPTVTDCYTCSGPGDKRLRARIACDLAQPSGELEGKPTCAEQTAPSHRTRVAPGRGGGARCRHDGTFRRRRLYRARRDQCLDLLCPERGRGGLVALTPTAVADHRHLLRPEHRRPRARTAAERRARELPLRQSHLRRLRPRHHGGDRRAAHAHARAPRSGARPAGAAERDAERQRSAGARDLRPGRGRHCAERPQRAIFPGERAPMRDHRLLARRAAGAPL